MRKIELTQTTANRLMALYREMDLVQPENFNQYHCSTCIIGHAVSRGIVNGFTEPDEEFTEAVDWVGLPKLKSFDGNGEYEFGVLGDFLFGTPYAIRDAALALNYPQNGDMNSMSPQLGQERIKTVLKAAGYELVWDKQ